MPDIESSDITDPLTEESSHVIVPIAQGLIVGSNGSVTALLTTSDEAFSKAVGYAMTTYEKEDGDTDGPPFDTDVPGIVGGCPPAGLLESAAAAQIVHPDDTVTPCLTDGVPLPMVASRPTDSTVTWATEPVRY